MKKLYGSGLWVWMSCLVVFMSLSGCDKQLADVPPLSFDDFLLYEDDIYAFGGGGIIRLDPLGNDSVKTALTISFGQPLYGKLSVEADGDTYYQPNTGFFGTDSLTYEACSEKTCQTQKIRMHVEKPLDPASCISVLGADSLETTRNTSKGIRIFLNDVICPQASRTIFAPQKGTFRTIEYAGSYKNTIYVYQPPTDFVGQDSFRYRVFPDPASAQYLEVVVLVTVK